MKYDMSSTGSKTGAPGGGGLDTDISMKAAVMNAALDLSALSSDFDISPACSTGNCTWPPYQSLGICSTCMDIASKLEAKSTTSGENWTLPNGLWLEVELYRISEGLLSLTINNSQIDQLPSVAFPGNRSEMSLLDLFVLVGPANYTSGVETAAFASECLLDVCLQSYSASEVNGTFREEPKGAPQLLSRPLGSSYPFSSGNFSFDYNTFNLLSTYLSETFYGLVKESDSLNGTVAFQEPIPQALFLAMNSTTHSLDTLMGNVAKSMTRNMRTRSDAGPLVAGNAASNHTFVYIEWGWISLPVAVLFAVLVFLLIVIMQTRARQFPQWKDSSLTTLFNGLDAECRSVASKLDDNITLEEVAENLLVRVENYEDSWGLRTTRSIH